VSARIDETADRFEQVIKHAIHVAPVEHKLNILAEHIRRTSRRVNALEQRLLPRLNQQIRFIRNTLDQREREDIFRLKRLKQKKISQAENEKVSSMNDIHVNSNKEEV
jgi:V/A-type H+-transporting ATPase subunit D